MYHSSRRKETGRGSEIPNIFDPLSIEEETIIQTRRGQALIVSLDILRMDAVIPGVHFIQADFLDPSAKDQLHRVIQKHSSLYTGTENSRQVDVVLSDMAPNVTGNKDHDSNASMDLLRSAYEFASHNLRTAEDIGRKDGGVFL